MRMFFFRVAKRLLRYRFERFSSKAFPELLTFPQIFPTSFAKQKSDRCLTAATWFRFFFEWVAVWIRIVVEDLGLLQSTIDIQNLRWVQWGASSHNIIPYLQKHQISWISVSKLAIDTWSWIRTVRRVRRALGNHYRCADPGSRINGKFWYTDPAGLVFLEKVLDVMNWHTPAYCVFQPMIHTNFFRAI